MANDLPYPPGFYGERAPYSLHLFSHNNNSTPEINFNEYVYFYSDTGRLSKKVVDGDILRAIIAKPVERQGMLDKLLMVNEVGDIASVHLPNFANVQAIIDDFGDGQVEYDGATPLVPKKLKEKIDPKPIIRRSGPTYTIGEKFSCDFGSYTDEIVYFQVRSPMKCLTFNVFRDQFMDDDPSSRYSTIELYSKREDDKPTLEYGASVIMWNDRRISRPPFKPHFTEVVATHKPALMIVTEVGAQITNCNRIIEALGTTMSWEVDPGLRIHGGSVVFWDPSRFLGVV